MSEPIFIPQEIYDRLPNRPFVSAEDLRKVLNAQSADRAKGEFVLVPREPTKEFFWPAYKQLGYPGGSATFLQRAWPILLATVPAPVAEPVQGVTRQSEITKVGEIDLAKAREDVRHLADEILSSEGDPYFTPMPAKLRAARHRAMADELDPPAQGVPVAWAQKGCEVACSKELEDMLNALPTTDPLPCIPLCVAPPLPPSPEQGVPDECWRQAIVEWHSGKDSETDWETQGPGVDWIARRAHALAAEGRKG